MAAKVNLGKMSLEELKALAKDVKKAIASYQDRQRAEALKEVQAVAKKHGMSVDELLGKKGKRKKSKVAPKYRNPANPSETWSGRGRQPQWFKDATKGGKSAKALEI